MNNKNEIKAIALADATPEQREQFNKLVAETIAREQTDHRCWFFVPSEKEYAHMQRFAADDTCPQCGKGRIVCEVHKSSICDCILLKCYWGEKGCDFAESVLDDDRI